MKYLVRIALLVAEPMPANSTTIAKMHPIIDGQPHFWLYVQNKDHQPLGKIEPLAIFKINR